MFDLNILKICSVFEKDQEHYDNTIELCMAMSLSDSKVLSVEEIVHYVLHKLVKFDCSKLHSLFRKRNYCFVGCFLFLNYELLMLSCTINRIFLKVWKAVAH